MKKSLLVLVGYNVNNCTQWDRKKEPLFSYEEIFLKRDAIRQNLVILLLMNIIIDVTYLIYGISTNFHRLLWKKCDVGHTSLTMV